MWDEVLDGVRGAAARVAHSLNEYGPPIEWQTSLASVQERGAAALGWAPPPAPPPFSSSRLLSAGPRQLGHWLACHRYGCAYVMGGALAVGLGVAMYRTRTTPPTHGATRDGRRTEAVVVLGGDTPLGRALALDLAARMLIVLVAVRDERAKHALEWDVPPSSKGYVKAYVLRPGAEDQFVHALHAALCLRFPLTAGGDPYARPGEMVQLLGVINAQSFAPDTDADPLARSAPQALEQALAQHVVTPLSTINRLLALLTALPNRVQERDPALLLTLVSLPAAQTAQPLHGAASIVAQSVRAGIATLRRESEVQFLEQRTSDRPRWTWLGGGRAQLRRLRWVLLELDAPYTRACATQHPAARALVRHHNAPAPPISAEVLEKVASLLFARKRPLWPRYTLTSASWARRWARALWTYLVPFLPSTLLDVLIATQLRFRAHRGAPAGNVEAHLHQLVREATAPPAALRPGQSTHTRGIPTRPT